MKAGVFVGAMYGQYQLFGAEETARGNPIALSSFYSSIANRVSYFFNLSVLEHCTRYDVFIIADGHSLGM